MPPLTQGPGFSYDDREAIVGNPVVEGEVPLVTAFGQDYWHHYEDAGHYRPLATLLLAMDRAASEEPKPLRFRWTNVGLHVVVTLLLGLAVIRLAARWSAPVPWFGLVIFAVHPVSADVVAWISGRTSLVSGLGAALGLALVSFVHPNGRAPAVMAWTGTVAGAGVALLGKEDGLVVAATLPMLAFLLGGLRAGCGGALGAVMAVVAVGWLRASALGSAMPSSPAPILEGMGLLDRLLVGAGAWGHGSLQVVAPWIDAPPSLEERDISSRAGVLWVFAVGLALYLLRRDGRPGVKGQSARAWLGTLSLGAMLLSVLPLIQLVPAGELFAPRFMYQPLLFGTFFVSWVGSVLFGIYGRGWSTAAMALACAGLIALSATSASARYHSRLSYWQGHLPAHDDSPKVWNAIGQAKQERGDIDGARAAYKRAVALDDSYGAPWAKLGELELRANDILMAESYLRRAIAEDPGAVAARANLARAILAAGDPEESVRFYREAIGLAPGRAALHRGLARALLAWERLDGAEAAIAEALRLSPKDRLSIRLAARIRARADSGE